MREIAEIELAIQGGTEKIEQLGSFVRLGHGMYTMVWLVDMLLFRRAGPGGRIYA